MRRANIVFDALTSPIVLAGVGAAIGAFINGLFNTYLAKQRHDYDTADRAQKALEAKERWMQTVEKIDIIKEKIQ